MLSFIPQSAVASGHWICTVYNLKGTCPPAENEAWVFVAQIVSLKGPQDAGSVAAGYGFTWQTSPSICCLLLYTAKNRLMILACSQEAAESSLIWLPSGSHFAAGSSCLSLKTDFEWVCETCCVSTAHDPAFLCLHKSLSLCSCCTWGGAGVLCWGGALLCFFLQLMLYFL